MHICGRKNIGCTFIYFVLFFLVVLQPLAVIEDFPNFSTYGKYESTLKEPDVIPPFFPINVLEQADENKNSAVFRISNFETVLYSNFSAFVVIMCGRLSVCALSFHCFNKFIKSILGLQTVI